MAREAVLEKEQSLCHAKPNEFGRLSREVSAGVCDIVLGNFPPNKALLSINMPLTKHFKAIATASLVGVASVTKNDERAC